MSEKVENELRNTERSLTEEICMLKKEINLLIDQQEVLTRSSYETKYQNAMIEICNVSEQRKFQQQIDNLDRHRKGFNDYFDKEETKFQLQQDKLKVKEVEIEVLKNKKLEINEQRRKRAFTVEGECESIESECNVLKKRNKAIMLQLRRKLLETDEIRRELIKNKHVEMS